MLILADKDITFLKWLYNRLVYRYNLAESDNICTSLKNIIHKVLCPININLSNSDLDKIISKYYVDFNLDKQILDINCNIGFTHEERIKLRNTIRSLVKDIINIDVPKDFLIKDK